MSIIARFSLIIIMFPYIGPLGGLDLQPFFLLAIFFLFIKRNPTISFSHLMVLISFALIIAFYGFFPTDAAFIDAFFTPLILISLFASLLSRAETKIFPINSSFIKIVSSIYLLVAFIQIFEPLFLTQLVSRSTDAVNALVESNRGVRSLCPEPAQFGRVLVSLNSIYILTALNENKKPIEVLLTTLFFLLGNIFLAQSLYSVVMHLFIIGSFLFICDFLQWKHRVMGLVVFSGFIFSFAIFLFESRMITLLILFLENSERIFDYGASNRLMNMITSIQGGLFNGSLFGYRFVDENYMIIFGQSFNIQPKLQGGYVELVYRFGIFGVFALLCIALTSLQSKNSNLSRIKRINIFILSYLILVPFQYGPLLNPFSLIFISLCIDSNRRHGIVNNVR